MTYGCPQYVPQVNPTIYNQQQRLAQMEQYYQPQTTTQVQQNGLNGRVVNDVNEVAASEVNLNGSPCVFIKNDLSEIYLKHWNQNGTIDTATYIVKLVPENEKEEIQSNEFQKSLDSFQKKLSSIEEKLNKVLDKPTAQRGGTKS